MTIKTSIRTIIFAVFCAVFGFTLFDGIQPAEANPDPKIEVCHFQIDNGLYKKLTIGVGAWPDHEMHGDRNAANVDDCNAPPPHQFVVAYINIDGQSGFDANIDIMIASVEDTNGSTVVDVGDTVKMGYYPLSTSGCSDSTSIEAFSVRSHAITDVWWAVFDGVSVISSDDDGVALFSFRSRDNEERFEEYYPYDLGRGHTVILDAIGGNWDWLYIDPDSPSHPQSSINYSTGGGLEDACFIDIEINLT